MKKENSVQTAFEAPTGRITRARAAASRATCVAVQSKPPLAKPAKKQEPRGKTKRDENSYAAPTAAFQHKKRAVLRDVTNICCETSLKGCINATKVQTKISQKIKSVPASDKLCSDKNVFKVITAIPVESKLMFENKEDKLINEELVFDWKKSEVAHNAGEYFYKCPVDGDGKSGPILPDIWNLRENQQIFCPTQHVKDDSRKNSVDAPVLDFVDIDSDHTNPQMCSLYSSDIYTNLLVAELQRRPSSNFMETVQRDITHSMRGILIDWLVEVSDEYKLVPDTLYITVNIIDRFLSKNYIERQRLQLLGITCMLIASKYEEICAPRVEEFCFITDNTYTKEEVLKMEIEVLNFLNFHLSVPTTKTFLRRFIRAAHTSYKVPPPALSHLANYFAELTLVEYSFLKYLPSVVAASAVFLARWTLEQSDHPWSPTLEHYSTYKPSQLKAPVLAIQQLQMNTNNCQLHAIREKYKQSKFESVSAMTSLSLRESLFC